MKKKEIWLIDDDPVFNLINKRVINKHRPEWEINTYTNASLVINNLKNSIGIKPDLILLDINMPEMDGWEFLDEVGKYSLLDPFETIVLMHTSSIDPRDYNKASSYEIVKDYTLKPLEWEALLSILNKNNVNV
jgi:CheY-like chemotaxis protein